MGYCSPIPEILEALAQRVRGHVVVPVRPITAVQYRVVKGPVVVLVGTWEVALTTSSSATLHRNSHILLQYLLSIFNWGKNQPLSKQYNNTCYLSSSTCKYAGPGRTTYRSCDKRIIVNHSIFSKIVGNIREALSPCDGQIVHVIEQDNEDIVGRGEV